MYFAIQCVKRVKWHSDTLVCMYNVCWCQSFHAYGTHSIKRREKRGRLKSVDIFHSIHLTLVGRWITSSILQIIRCMTFFCTELKFIKSKMVKRKKNIDAALFTVHSGKFTWNIEDRVPSLSRQTCVMIVTTALQLYCCNLISGKHFKVLWNENEDFVGCALR